MGLVSPKFHHLAGGYLVKAHHLLWDPFSSGQERASVGCKSTCSNSERLQDEVNCLLEPWLPQASNFSIAKLIHCFGSLSEAIAKMALNPLFPLFISGCEIDTLA